MTIYAFNPVDATAIAPTNGGVNAKVLISIIDIAGHAHDFEFSVSAAETFRNALTTAIVAAGGA